MADKKKIILIALAAISAFVWGSRGLGVILKSRRVSASPAVSSVSAARQARKSEYKDYKRNPFTAAAVSQPQGAGLQLGGIMYDDKELYCLINDQIVRAGDTVGAYRVSSIAPNKVTLSDGAKEIELKLEE